MLVRFLKDHIEGLREGEEKHLPEWLAKKLIEQGSAEKVEVKEAPKVIKEKKVKDEKNIN
jgi:hypothetical protein